MLNTMRENIVKLIDLKFKLGLEVIGNTFIEVDKTTRLYYFKDPDSDSFEFIYVTVVVSYLGVNTWEYLDKTEVEILFTGIAYFDGVRHIYFGEEGYINYPNLKSIIKGLEELKKLEIKYCPEI